MNNPILNIYISENEISLAFCNDYTSNIISSKQVLKDYQNLREQDLIRLFSDQPEFEINFVKVNALVDSDCFCLIPALYERSEQRLELYRLLFSNFSEERDELIASDIKKREIIINFSMGKNIYNALKSFFPNITIQHPVGVFIEKCWCSETVIFVNYFEKYTDILLFSENQLQMAKRAFHSCAEDLLYNILSIIELFKLDSTETPVVFANTERSNPNYTFLQKYLKQLHLDTNNK